MAPKGQPLPSATEPASETDNSANDAVNDEVRSFDFLGSRIAIQGDVSAESILLGCMLAERIHQNKGNGKGKKGEGEPAAGQSQSMLHERSPVDILSQFENDLTWFSTSSSSGAVGHQPDALSVPLRASNAEPKPMKKPSANTKPKSNRKSGKK